MQFNRRKFLQGLLAVPVAAAIAIKTEMVVFEDYAAGGGLNEIVTLTKRYIYPTKMRDLFFAGESPLLNYIRTLEHEMYTQGNGSLKGIPKTFTNGIPTTNAFTHNQTNQRKIQDEQKTTQ